MSRPHPAVALLLLLGLLLIGIIGLELRRAPSGVAAPRAAATAIAPRETPPAEPTEAQVSRAVATVLARPLFAPTRRPPAEAPPAPAQAAPPPKPPPRLAGIVISSVSRAAIFAPDSGDKPVVVQRGGRIGDFVVRSIAPDAVLVDGPQGSTVLHVTHAEPAAAGAIAGEPAGGTVPAAPVSKGLPPPPAPLPGLPSAATWNGPPELVGTPSPVKPQATQP